MGKSRLWSYISFEMVVIICLFVSPFSWAKSKGLAPSSQKVSVSEFLRKVKNNSTPLGTVKSDSLPDVTVHLLWATWCTYCDQIISALTSLKNDKKYENVTVISYSFDKEKPNSEHEKLKKMILFKNFHVAIKLEEIPEELARLPVLIIENNKNKDLSVYTGFSPERFRLFTKKIDRSLNRLDSYEAD